MFDFDDTEAAHLSEIEECRECYFPYDSVPYSEKEKKWYVKARGQCFKKSDVGKYVVIQNSRKNRKVMPTMFLVDRSKTKHFWWSPASIFAMVFDKQSAAEIQAKKYKYNNARVMQITYAMANQEYFEREYE